MSEAYILDAVRIPRAIGKLGKGAYSGMHPQHLAATVLKAIQERNGFDTKDVQDVIWGCAGGMGKQGGSMGRMAALDAGYDVTVSGCSVERFCGSGLSTTAFAAAQAMSGMEDLIIAGGTEMMSYVNDLSMKIREAGVPTPSGMGGGNERLSKRHPQSHQGLCGDAIASMEGFTREELDAYALESQRRAAVAIKEGRFDNLPMKNGTDPASVYGPVCNDSIVGSDEEGDLDETKAWRLQWWGKIVDYTIHGDYFWQGKGFGVNLANSDGFQVEYDSTPLRSPHNGHLTVLARMGVPGLVLWALIHLSWLYAMVNTYLRARQRGHVPWMMLFVFLVAYWLALNFNAAFDVYFEGPMGGIWLWSVIGFGLAAVWVYDHRPDVLLGPEFEVTS